MTELVRLANQGEEVVLTQDGNAAVRLEPVKKPIDPKARDAIIERIQKEVRELNLPPGVDAARSQDFLYDEYGLPK